jgi:hypothetical protein
MPDLDPSWQFNRVNIARCLAEHGIVPMQALLFADDRFACPKESWVRDTFPGLYRDELIRRDLTKYEEERNDCDDFTRLACVYANQLHNQAVNMTGEYANTSLAVGEFWYTRDDGVGHALAVFIVSRQGVATPVFFDGTTNLITAPSPQEINTCRVVRF